VISALNLVLKQHASRGGFRLGQNRYFFTPRERLQLSQGVQAWQGFFISVRPVFKQLMVLTSLPFLVATNRHVCR
jgi:eukaryotic translation initiation factor 2C